MEGKRVLGSNMFAIYYHGNVIMITWVGKNDISSNQWKISKITFPRQINK